MIQYNCIQLSLLPATNYAPELPIMLEIMLA